MTIDLETPTNEFTSGQAVFWLYTVRRGWNETLWVNAEVISVSQKRVKIKVFKPDGSFVVRNVKLEKLKAK